MYRKHLKMARGEGESGIRSHFVERVVKLPVVHVAWDYAANTYSHIKESNKLVNFTLTNAEKSVNFVAGQAKPVVLKFEKQIQAVDNLACKGLVTLEEKVPFIKKPADEIIDDTRKLYSDTVSSRLDGIRKYGTDKVKSVADYGLQKANVLLGNRLVQSILTTVDGALVVTESYVDHLLPPSEEENKEAAKKKDQKSQSSLSHLTNISNKVRHRTYRTLVLKFEHIQELALDLLIVYPMGMIEFSKSSLESVYKYVAQLWATFKKAESEDKDAEEKSQSPVALSAVRDGALWMMGMIRLIPALLPMYIYGFVSWLNKKKDENALEVVRDGKKDAKENGSVPSEHNSASHNCANSNSHNHERKSDQNCVAEENQES